MNNKTFFVLATCAALVAGCDSKPHPNDVVVEREPAKSEPATPQFKIGDRVRINMGRAHVDAYGIIEDTHELWRRAYVVFVDTDGHPVRMLVNKQILTKG